MLFAKLQYRLFILYENVYSPLVWIRQLSIGRNGRIKPVLQYFIASTSWASFIALPSSSAHKNFKASFYYSATILSLSSLSLLTSILRYLFATLISSYLLQCIRQNCGHSAKWSDYPLSLLNEILTFKKVFHFGWFDFCGNWDHFSTPILDILSYK